MPFPSPFRVLTLHAALFGLASAMAGGFVGAYLLRLGLGLPLALAAYAALVALRFGLRLVALAVVRRLGFVASLRAGALLSALAFVPLALAGGHPAWLALWVLTASLAESLYWPVHHACTAATAATDRLGRQVAERATVASVVNVAGPLLGGLALGALGEGAGFAIGALVCALSALPLRWLGEVPAGPVPAARQTLAGLDRRGVGAFAAEGWLAAGTSFAWPMVLFSALGGAYEGFGAATAAAGLLGAAAAPLCGRAVDRGRRGPLLALVCAAVAASVALRAGAAWSPLAATAATLAAAALAGLYAPVVTSALYGRARGSGSIFRFQLGCEAGWDLGAALGLLAAAAVAWASPVASLCVLPAALGAAGVHFALRDPSPARLRGAAPAGAG